MINVKRNKLQYPWDPAAINHKTTASAQNYVLGQWLQKGFFREAKFTFHHLWWLNRRDSHRTRGNQLALPPSWEGGQPWWQLHHHLKAVINKDLLFPKEGSKKVTDGWWPWALPRSHSRLFHKVDVREKKNAMGWWFTPRDTRDSTGIWICF